MGGERRGGGRTEEDGVRTEGHRPGPSTPRPSPAFLCLARPLLSSPLLSSPPPILAPGLHPHPCSPSPLHPSFLQSSAFPSKRPGTAAYLAVVASPAPAPCYPSFPLSVAPRAWADRRGAAGGWGQAASRQASPVISAGVGLPRAWGGEGPHRLCHVYYFAWHCVALQAPKTIVRTMTFEGGG